MQKAAVDNCAEKPRATLGLERYLHRRRRTEISRWRAWPGRTVANSVWARRRLVSSPADVPPSREHPRRPVAHKEVPHKPWVVDAPPDKNGREVVVPGKGGERKSLYGGAPTADTRCTPLTFRAQSRSISSIFFCVSARLQSVAGGTFLVVKSETVSRERFGRFWRPLPRCGVLGGQSGDFSLPQRLHGLARREDLGRNRCNMIGRENGVWGGWERSKQHRPLARPNAGRAGRTREQRCTILTSTK